MKANMNENTAIVAKTTDNMAKLSTKTEAIFP